MVTYRKQSKKKYKMNLICKTKRNYALTVGKEYTVLDETGNYVLIQNDNGKTTRYYRTLFKVDAVKAKPAVPTAPPPPPDPVFTFNVEDIDTVNETLSIRHGFDGNNSDSVTLTVQVSDMGCGIYVMSNLSSLTAIPSEHFTTVFNSIVNSLEDAEDKGIILCNHNTGFIHYNAMTELANISTEYYNPGSENTNTLWTFYINQD